MAKIIQSTAINSMFGGFLQSCGLRGGRRRRRKSAFRHDLAPTIAQPEWCSDGMRDVVCCVADRYWGERSAAALMNWIHAKLDDPAENPVRVQAADYFTSELFMMVMRDEACACMHALGICAHVAGPRRAATRF